MVCPSYLNRQRESYSDIILYLKEDSHLDAGEPSERASQETLWTSQSPKIQHQSPAFLRLLLPSANLARSPSPDEIPGLGSLPPLDPIPQFVSQKMTVPLVTAGLSWFRVGSASSNRIRGLKMEPEELDLSLIQDVQMHRDEEMFYTSQDTRMQSLQYPAEASPSLEQIMPSTDNSQGTLPHSPALPVGKSLSIVTPIIRNRDRSRVPPFEDDDSDMDFGTPVMSPVIIVPGPQHKSTRRFPPANSSSSFLSRGSEASRYTPQDRTSSPIVSITPEAVTRASTYDAALNNTRFRGSLSSIETVLKPIMGPGPSTNVDELLSPTLVRRPHGNDCPSLTASKPSSPPRQIRPLDSFLQSVPAAGSIPSQDQPFSVKVQPAQVNGHAFRQPFFSSPESQEYFHSFDDIAYDRVNQLDLIPRGESSRPRPLPRQSQPTILDRTSIYTSRCDRRSDITSPTMSFLDDVHQDNSTVSRKRQRGDGDEDEIEDEDQTALKSRKQSENISVRDGGVVVRRVVSMVRDTLIGLNDLLGITAESELAPLENMRERSKGKAKELKTLTRTLTNRESPLYTPPIPVNQTLIRTHGADTSDITRLSEDFWPMTTEMAEIKETGLTSEPSAGHEYVRKMQAELGMLREQVLTLKKTKASPEQSEIEVIKNELLSLRSEVRSLQDTSYRPTVPSVSSTPSTPSLALRFNSLTMTNTVHPLAHLLAVEDDTIPSPPTAAVPSTHFVPVQMDGASHASHAPHGDKTGEGTSSTPHPRINFDDISLPVKAKRKAHNIYSRS